MEIVCNSCGAIIKDGDAFCGKCGTPVDRKVYCPSCGAEVEDGDTFCRKCGHKIVPIAASKTDLITETPASSRGDSVSVELHLKLPFEYNGEFSGVLSFESLFEKLSFILQTKGVAYYDTFDNEVISITKDDVKKSIKTMYRLLVDNKAISKYPPVVDGEIISDDRINGFIVLMDLHEFMIKEDIIVYYRNMGDAEKIEFSKLSELSKEYDSWWDAYKATPKYRDIPSLIGINDNYTNSNNNEASEIHEQNTDKYHNDLTKCIFRIDQHGIYEYTGTGLVTYDSEIQNRLNIFACGENVIYMLHRSNSSLSDPDEGKLLIKLDPYSKSVCGYKYLKGFAPKKAITSNEYGLFLPAQGLCCARFIDFIPWEQMNNTEILYDNCLHYESDKKIIQTFIHKTKVYSIVCGDEYEADSLLKNRIGQEEGPYIEEYDFLTQKKRIIWSLYQAKEDFDEIVSEVKAFAQSKSCLIRNIGCRISGGFANDDRAILGYDIRFEIKDHIIHQEGVVSIDLYTLKRTHINGPTILDETMSFITSNVWNNWNDKGDSGYKIERIDIENDSMWLSKIRSNNGFWYLHPIRPLKEIMDIEDSNDIRKGKVNGYYDGKNSYDFKKDCFTVYTSKGEERNVEYGLHEYDSRGSNGYYDIIGNWVIPEVYDNELTMYNCNSSFSSVSFKTFNNDVFYSRDFWKYYNKGNDM